MNSWSVNEYGALTEAQMQNNASIIHTTLSSYGWSDNAISALLGNMQAESGINPGQWENGIVGELNSGLGLVQWTPASKLINWVNEQYFLGNLPDDNYLDGDNQIARIKYEIENNIQYSPTEQFPENFAEWSLSNKNPGYLAAAFMKNYERPHDQNWKVQIERARNARKWYIYLTGADPGAWIPAGLVACLKKTVDKQKGVF